MNNFDFNGFNVQLNGKTLSVSKDGEEATYIIKEANNGIEHNKGDEYFYIRTTHNGFYYQFKFEGDDFLVGDIFADNGEFLDTFACFVFGEN